MNTDKKTQANNQIKDVRMRFYYWEFSCIYGWRQLGSMDGYPSLDELKESMVKSTEFRDNPIVYAILQSEIIEDNLDE